MRKYLFVNLYDAGQQRNDEFAECLEKNKKVFDKIFVLSDLWYQGVENIPCKGVSTIDEFAGEINKHNGEINVIANADVWFKELPDLSGMTDNTMYALTRYEDGCFFCRQDSADAWIFKGKVTLKGCNFRLGLRGTDNALAARALKCGYRVVNPSLDIRINHVHKFREENNQYAPQPYDMAVRPTTLNEHCILFYTSINPYDRQKEQKEAVDSWLSVANSKVVSFNTRSEILVLQDSGQFDDVIFIERDDAIEGKYQRLSTMYDTVKNIEADWYIFINSDILLGVGFPDLLSRDCFILGVRNDLYSDDTIVPFEYGYDVFMMRRRHLELMNSNTRFAIGLPFHDFYTPLVMIRNNERIHVDRTHFFHRWHKTRYDYDVWLSMGEYSRYILCFEKGGNTVGNFTTINKEFIERHLDSQLKLDAI